MNHAEFQTQMARLCETFGKVAYGTERTKLIWREVQSLEARWFESAIDGFIGDRTAPMLGEFRQAAAGARRRESQQRDVAQVISLEDRYRCNYCRDRGVYLCRSNVTPGLFAFRCHCPRGEQDERKAIPQYREGHFNEFCWVDVAKALKGEESA